MVFTNKVGNFFNKKEIQYIPPVAISINVYFFLSCKQKDNLGRIILYFVGIKMLLLFIFWYVDRGLILLCKLYKMLLKIKKINSKCLTSVNLEPPMKTFVCSIALVRS